MAGLALSPGFGADPLQQYVPLLAKRSLPAAAICGGLNRVDNYLSK